MIPLVRPLFPPIEDISKFFSQSLETGLLSNFGPCYDMLVNRLKIRTGMYTLPVATGTAAIQLAIQTHFNRGARIAIPDYTHIGTLQAVIAAGCIPVMFPVERHTWTLDLNAVQQDIRSLEGCVVVSPFGYGVNTERYDTFAKENKKILIYDFAGAWGTPVRTHHTVCYSLHATKNFSCGEGGLILFHRKVDFHEARRLSNFDTLPDRTVNSEFGSNLKMDEMKCAVVLAHLEREDRILSRIQAKRDLLRLYQSELKALCLHDPPWVGGAPSLCVLGGMKADLIEERSSVQGFVAKKYYPLLSHMQGLEDIERQGCSGPYFQTCLALPSDATVEEAERVVQAVKRILKT